ncbi:MAG: signal peptidase I [Oscillospiraceae bacterium]|nr:signal peptidase I [Oscillospiraceae bacterium]
MEDEEEEEFEEPDGPSEFFGWVQAVISTVIVVVLIFTFALRIISVDGSSMYPTLYNNDRIITVSRLIDHNYEYGDIVVLRKKSFQEEAIVKRVIATEGQTVNIDFYNGLVYVDGVILQEEYINEPTFLSYDTQFPLVVPEGCIFIMGDNRNASIDSRSTSIGVVDERSVLGKAVLIALPGVGEEPYNEGGRQFSRISFLTGRGAENG